MTQTNNKAQNQNWLGSYQAEWWLLGILFISACWSSLHTDYNPDGSKPFYHWVPVLVAPILYLYGISVLKDRFSSLMLILMAIPAITFKNTLSVIALLPFLPWLLLFSQPVINQISRLFNPSSKKRNRRTSSSPKNREKRQLILLTLWLGIGLITSLCCPVKILYKGLITAPPLCLLILSVFQKVSGTQARGTPFKWLNIHFLIADLSMIGLFFATVTYSFIIFEWLPGSYPKNYWPLYGKPLINQLLGFELPEPILVWKFWLAAGLIILIGGGVFLITLRFKQQEKLIFPAFTTIWFTFWLFFQWIAHPVLFPPIHKPWIKEAQKLELPPESVKIYSETEYFNLDWEIRKNIQILTISEFFNYPSFFHIFHINNGVVTIHKPIQKRFAAVLYRENTPGQP